MSYQPVVPGGADLIGFLPGGGPGAGTVEAVLHGMPGVEYGFQRSLNLTNWLVIQSALAGDDGILIFNDPAPPAGRAFYRAITPVPAP